MIANVCAQVLLQGLILPLSLPVFLRVVYSTQLLLDLEVVYSTQLLLDLEVIV
jgi:hypothetical protein